MYKQLSGVIIALTTLTLSACSQKAESSSTTQNLSGKGEINANPPEEIKYSFLPRGDSTRHTIHISDFADFWNHIGPKHPYAVRALGATSCGIPDMPSAVCVDSQISLDIEKSILDKNPIKIDLAVLGKMNRLDLKGYVLDTAKVLQVDEKRKEYLIELVSMLPSTDAPRIYTWFFIDSKGEARLLDIESDFTGAKILLDFPNLIITHSGIFKKDGESLVHFKKLFEVSDSLPIVSLERIGQDHLFITNPKYLYVTDLEGKIIAKEKYSGVEQEFFLSDRIAHPELNHIYACDCNNFRVITVSAGSLGIHIYIDSLSKLPRAVQKAKTPLLFDCFATEQNPGAIALYRDASGRPISYVLAKIDYSKR